MAVGEQQAILGVHGFGSVSAQLAVLKKWQPALIVWVDPSAQTLQHLRSACPRSTIIARIYVPDGEMQARILADPAAAARWADEQVMASGLARLADYWILENEICQELDQIDALNAYSLSRIGLAQAGGYGVAIGGFSVGRPDLTAWPHFYPAMRAARATGQVLAIHQYGADADMLGPAGQGGAAWLLERYETQVWPTLPADLQDLPVAITEYGLDQLLYPGQSGGWKTIISADTYLDDLLRQAEHLAAHRPPFIGAAIFCLGNNGDPRWLSYDIAGEVAESLADALNESEEPTMPADLNWDPALDELTIQNDKIMGVPCGVLKVVSLSPGDVYYRLVAAHFIDEEEAKGIHTVTVDVLDEQGRRAEGVVVEMGWPWDRYPETDGTDRQTVFGAHLAEFGIYAGYEPDKVVGPYWFRIADALTDVFYGAGLPWNRHVSFVLTFQRARVLPDVDDSLNDYLANIFEQNYADLRDDLPVAPDAEYPTRDLAGVDQIVIHHSATTIDTSPESIAHYHVDNRHWPGIGYHFLVTTGGFVYYVGDVKTIRYNVADENDHIIGICCIGDFEADTPATIPMIQAVHLLINALRLKLDLPLTVKGHFEMPGSQTLCPGQAIIDWLPYLDCNQETLDQATLRRGENSRLLRLNPQAALMKAIRRDGFVPVGNETTMIQGQTLYAIWLAENMTSGETRVYRAPAGDWERVDFIVRPYGPQDLFLPSD